RKLVAELRDRDEHVMYSLHLDRTSPEEQSLISQRLAGWLEQDRRSQLWDRKKSDPSTPEGALAIKAGRLVYRNSGRMWVGVQEIVEVRLGSVITNAIMLGFVGRGDVRDEHVPIVETMSVSLVCKPGAFDIEPRSEKDQLVKPDLL